MKAELTENDVLSIKPVSYNGSNEELRAVGVWTGVGHREQARLGVLEPEVLI